MLRANPGNAMVDVLHSGSEEKLQCTTYLLHGPVGSILIDPGSGAEEEVIMAALASAGCPPGNVLAILLTHCHIDHSQGAGALAGRLSVPLVASAQTADWLRQGDRRIWREHPERIRKIAVDLQVSDGETLEFPGITVKCLATPGHTDGCLSYQVERVAFTGDLLMANPLHPGWAGGEDFSEKKTLRSLKLLLEQGIQVAYTGHGTVPGDAREWVRRGIEHGLRGEWILKR